MGKTIEIQENRYYHGTEADQFSFLRLPKILFIDPQYKELSVEAKVIYGAMLDRMSLSVRENWLDEQGRVFIYFTLENIYAYLNCKKEKAIKILKELEDFQMITRKKQGFGMPNMIYVLKINYLPSVSKDYEDNSEALEYANQDDKTPLVGKTDLSWSEKQTYAGTKNRPAVVGKSNSIKTEINNTEFNKTEREQARARKDNNAQGKKSYGPYDNVLLTPEEYEKLKEEFAEPEKLIRKVSLILKESERKVKDHLAYVRKIGLEDGFEEAGQVEESKKDKNIDIASHMNAAFDDETALMRGKNVKARMKELGLTKDDDPQHIREVIAADFKKRWGRALEISLDQIKVPTSEVENKRSSAPEYSQYKKIIANIFGEE